MDTRHEQYGSLVNGLPFVLHIDLERSGSIRSENSNWHENLELQICTQGSGSVMLDGKRYSFEKDDVVAVNASVLHYTGTETELRYTCLIVSSDFCRYVGLDPTGTFFEPIFRDGDIARLFYELAEIYKSDNTPCRNMRLSKTLLEILIRLSERHTVQIKEKDGDSRRFDTVKTVISYIRENYRQRITVDEIAKEVLYDKYALCRDFKRLTGQTLIENLNNYRCIKALDLLCAGYGVADAASLCGFENPSFFTRIFKRYMGKLPSECKKRK